MKPENQIIFEKVTCFLELAIGEVGIGMKEDFGGEW
jgi:hypothetical protein